MGRRRLIRRCSSPRSFSPGAAAASASKPRLLGRAADPRRRRRRADGREGRRLVPGRRPADGAGARGPRLRPQAAPRAAARRSSRRSSRPYPTVTDPTQTTTVPTTTTAPADHHDHDDHRRPRRAAGRREAGAEPGPAGDDGPARPPPRAVARARPGGERVLGRRPRRRPQGSRPLRHRGRRPPARAPPEPPRAATTRSSCSRTTRRRRAEAAYSAAQILQFPGWEIERRPEPRRHRSRCPSSPTGRSRSSTTAFARVGMPYIWGGMSDGPQTEFGVPSRGGYDCSGLRLARLQARDLRGRGHSRLGAPRPDDLPDERRGPEVGADRPREPRAGRRHLLRRPRPALPAVAGRPHGDLRRERLVRPLVRATASRSRGSTAGTRRSSRGPAGRSPRPASTEP